MRNSQYGTSKLMPVNAVVIHQLYGNNSYVLSKSWCVGAFIAFEISTVHARRRNGIIGCWEQGSKVARLAGRLAARTVLSRNDRMFERLLCLSFQIMRRPTELMVRIPCIGNANSAGPLVGPCSGTFGLVWSRQHGRFGCHGQHAVVALFIAMNTFESLHNRTFPAIEGTDAPLGDVPAWPPEAPFRRSIM